MEDERMALDEDTRHSDRNADARQRAADQMRPAVRKLLAEMLCDGDEDELPAARDAIKDLIRVRKLRQERTEKAVSDMLMGMVKWIGGIATGAITVWFATHKGGGQ